MQLPAYKARQPFLNKPNISSFANAAYVKRSFQPNADPLKLSRKNCLTAKLIALSLVIAALAAEAFANGITQDYTEQSRPLVSALNVTKTATSASLMNLGFGYDAVGNLTSTTDALTLGYARSASYDGFDRILSNDAALPAARDQVIAGHHPPRRLVQGDQNLHRLGFEGFALAVAGHAQSRGRDFQGAEPKIRLARQIDGA